MLDFWAYQNQTSTGGLNHNGYSQAQTKAWNNVLNLGQAFIKTKYEKGIHFSQMFDYYIVGLNKL